MSDTQAAPFDDFGTVTIVEEEERRRRALANTRIGAGADKTTGTSAADGKTDEDGEAANPNVLNGEEVVKTTVESKSSASPKAKAAKSEPAAKEN